jgi:hypothetical protein
LTTSISPIYRLCAFSFTLPLDGSKDSARLIMSAVEGSKDEYRGISTPT